MGNMITKQIFFDKELIYPLLLLLLAFPPAPHFELFWIQKLQLIAFFLAGGVFAIQRFSEKRMIMLMLSGLFIIFPIMYGIAGILKGCSPYTVGKEVLFFATPFFMYMIFLEMKFSKKIVQLIVWYALFAAALQIVFFCWVFLADGLIERYRFRWLLLYLSFPILIVGLWITVSENIGSGLRKWIVAAVLMLGMLSILSRGAALGVGALAVFIAGGFFRSPKRMRIWIAALSLVPLFYMGISYHGVKISGREQLGWRSYETQTFFSTCGLEHSGFWIGNAFGWELPVKKGLRVFGSKVLHKINKFHNFWLYLLSKMGLVGTIVFWGVLLFFLFYVNELPFYRFTGRLPRFLLGYLVFLCFVAWNYYGGPPMAFQQGALFGLALALIQSDERDSALSGEVP